jgi:hypothetical protein
MFPTSCFRPLVSCCVLLTLALASGCGEGAHKSPENKGDSGGASVPAGADAGAENDAGGASSSAGSSAVDDSSYAGNDSADGECRSGQTRCHGQLGFQRCTPENVWGASQSCGGYSENGTSSYCAVFDSGGGPWAACVDPACWWWKESGLGTEDDKPGVCVGTDQVRRCVAGILRQPEACAGGCRRVAELDGRVLGYCEAACDDGARECLGGALYRECVDGSWSTDARTCADGALCQPLALSLRPDIKCGGACESGTSRCADDGLAVERCSDAQEWISASPCALGRCVSSGAQAQCQTECKPGEHACAFDGAAAESTCDDVGLWREPVTCEDGATCRVGTAGAWGCMKCVGPAVTGGNAWGVNDSRCEDAGVAQCGSAGDYEAAAACGDGQACVELRRGAARLAYCK